MGCGLACTAAEGPRVQLREEPEELPLNQPKPATSEVAASLSGRRQLDATLVSDFHEALSIHLLPHDFP